MSLASIDRTGQKTLAAAGLALLALWAGLWVVSVSRDRLVKGHRTWIPCCPFLACDFDINYYATRTWLAGGNPYDKYPKAGFDLKYDHPPPVLVLFSWCNLLPHRTAVVTWLLAQTAILALGVAACRRARGELGLWPVPLPLALAVVLWSFPVLFEQERGNWNVLVLLLVVLSAAALRRQSRAGDVTAGVGVGLAAWIKVYPGLLLLALLALRRWRAAAACAAVGLLIGLASAPLVPQFAANIAESARGQAPTTAGHHFPWSHTLGGAWPLLCADLRLPGLARLPGAVGWALLVLPGVFWVSRRVARAADPAPLVFPYLLWLTAAATYLPTIANDYNLFFLPLAALAVWDRRDRVAVHVLMAAVLLWWQPLALPVSANFLWFCKLLGLGVVGASLAARARERALPAQAAADPAPQWREAAAPRAA